MTKSYYTVDGQILAESSGGVRTGYLPDALGNVTATVDEAGAIVNTYRYKPYGEQLSKTGAGGDPKFQWNGAHGYRQTGTPSADTYVRARHYNNGPGSWTTRDPLGYGVNLYHYVGGNPITRIDPSGLIATQDDSCKSNPLPLAACCKKLTDILREKPFVQLVGQIADCMADKGFPKDATKHWIAQVLGLSLLYCNDGWAGGGTRVCFRCLQGLTIPPNCPVCKGGLAQVIKNPLGAPDVPPPIGGPPTYESCIEQKGCESLFGDKSCRCTVIVCTKDYRDDEFCSIMFHEIVHCSGTGGGPHHDQPPFDDIVYAFSCCLCEAMYGKGNPICQVNCRNWK